MADLPDDAQNQPLSPTGSIVKEKESLVGPEALRNQEKIPVVEVGKFPETAAEKEGLAERLVKEALTLPKAVRDERTGEVLVEGVETKQPKIVLPLSQDSYLNPKNWHRPVTWAIRWLLTWTKRIMKMYPEKTTFGK